MIQYRNGLYTTSPTAGKRPAGAGILTITDKYIQQFNTLLLDYYNTGDSADLKVFLYENAIYGITL